MLCFKQFSLKLVKLITFTQYYLQYNLVLSYLNIETMTFDADILIIGADPSGSSSATFLARNVIKALLLGKSCFPRNKICGDGLTPRAVSVIERLGVLAEVTKISQRIDKAKIISPKGTESLHEMKDIDDGSTYMLATPRYDLDNVLLQNSISQGTIFKEPLNN